MTIQYLYSIKEQLSQGVTPTLEEIGWLCEWAEQALTTGKLSDDEIDRIAQRVVDKLQPSTTVCGPPMNYEPIVIPWTDEL